MALNKDILDEYTEKTSYDIVSFFNSFQSFMIDLYPNIIAYYSGSISDRDQKSFNKLDVLYNEIQNVFESFSLNGKVLNNYKFWELIDQIEQIETFLLSLKNAAKWYRSSISVANYDINISLNVLLKQGQTLENLAKNVAKSSDWDNYWETIAQDNDLNEEDYTPQGGNNINVKLPNSSQSFKLDSIVDVMYGDTVLGKDFNKKITFKNNDIEYLSPKDTFFQTVNILSLVRKTSIPEFPDDGFNSKLVAGTNLNSIVYPSLFRQITETFNGDDSIKSFQITDFRREQDGFFLTFKVESWLQTFLTYSVII